MRPVLFLAAIWGALYAAEGGVERAALEERSLKGRVRPLKPDLGSVESVDALEVATAEGTWRYARRDSTWLHPDLSDAFADEESIDRLLRGLEASAIVVDVYGSSTGKRLGAGSVTVGIFTGSERVAIRIGSALPGVTVPARFVQIVGSDTIFQLHADPLSAIGAIPVDAPLLDPRVVPRALERKGVVGVDVDGPGGPRRLKRIEISNPRSGNPTGLDYAWFQEADGKVDSLDLRSAYTYVNYLQDLRFARPVDRRPIGDTESVGSIVLENREGTRDTLDIWVETAGGPGVTNLSTDRRYRLTAGAMSALFPAIDLTQSLPEHHPFE